MSVCQVTEGRDTKSDAAYALFVSHSFSLLLITCRLQEQLELIQLVDKNVTLCESAMCYYILLFHSLYYILSQIY